MPSDPSSPITTIVLDCGMPLVVEVVPGVRSAAVTWLLPIGSGHDPIDRQGLSTLLSELVFRGAGTLSSRQQADAFDALGLARGSDVGGVFLRLSASMVSDKMLPTLGLLTDIVRRVRLDAEHLAPAKDLAQQALSGLKDDPQSRAGILLGERFGPLPLNRSGMGTADGLVAVTRDDLVAAWAKNVRPRGSILAVAGHVNPAEIAAHLNTLLQGWEGDAPSLTLSRNPLRDTYLHQQDNDSSQVQIFLAHDAPAESHADSTLERIVMAVLSSGSSSRLFTEVREKRALCYSVHAGYAAEKFHGRVTGYVGTTPEKAQQSLDVMIEQFHKMQLPQGRATEGEFSRAVVGFKSKLIFSGESTAARAASIATDFYRLGRARSLAEIAAQISAVSIADINTYLARRSIGNLTIVTLGPTGLTVG